MQLVIELPPRHEQIAFNRTRWRELCADPQLAKLPGRIETNAHGNILMTPPPSGTHSSRQGEIAFLLRTQLGGRALPECPISTIDGIRAADVGWYSEERYATVRHQQAFETAPEICVEVRSPANTDSELAEKRMLYFDAGAREVWICDEQGRLHFFTSPAPATAAQSSRLCPTFPTAIA